MGIILRTRSQSAWNLEKLDEALKMIRDAAAKPIVTIVDLETPTGVVDGENREFTLAHAPTPKTTIKLYRNGLKLQLDGDFTLSGNLITYAAPLNPGDVHEAYYRYY